MLAAPASGILRFARPFARNYGDRSFAAGRTVEGMLVAWLHTAYMPIRAEVARRVADLRARRLDVALRPWLRGVFTNSREVQGDAAIPAGWLAAYVAIGALWHAVHMVVAVVESPFVALARLIR